MHGGKEGHERLSRESKNISEVRPYRISESILLKSRRNTIFIGDFLLEKECQAATEA